MSAKIHDKPRRPGGELRGSSYARRARRWFLVQPEAGFGGTGEYTGCAHGCLTLLAAEHANPAGAAKLEVDKIRTLRENGTYARGNIQPSCPPCNRARGDSPMPWASPHRPTRAQLTLAN